MHHGWKLECAVSCRAGQAGRRGAIGRQAAAQVDQKRLHHPPLGPHSLHERHGTVQAAQHRRHAIALQHPHAHAWAVQQRHGGRDGEQDGACRGREAREQGEDDAAEGRCRSARTRVCQFGAATQHGRCTRGGMWPCILPDRLILGSCCTAACIPPPLSPPLRSPLTSPTSPPLPPPSLPHPLPHPHPFPRSRVQRARVPRHQHQQHESRTLVVGYGVVPAVQRCRGGGARERARVGWRSPPGIWTARQAGRACGAGHARGRPPPRSTEQPRLLLTGEANHPLHVEHVEERVELAVANVQRASGLARREEHQGRREEHLGGGLQRQHCRQAGLAGGRGGRCVRGGAAGQAADGPDSDSCAGHLLKRQKP